MKLYNTMSRQLETLKPLNPPEVSIYSCGPTVYGEAHIGNWSAYVYWDILVRTLEASDYKVKRVINLTDVGHLVSDADDGEDKLAKKAYQEQTTAWKIADTYIAKFMEGFKELKLVQPTYFARATEFIDEQLDLVRRLKELGLTYQISDGIYLDTSKIKDYGRLARLDLDQLKAGARVEYNPEKRQPSDFAVWKFSGELKRDMEWETPTELLDDKTQGKMGFPGWHLECSAIIYKLLGEQIDIHTGGIDHIPVHHTNEIAQMEPITHKNVAQIWLHNNHMQIDAQKISKSLGNTYTLSDLAERGFSSMDLKLFVLQSHFQSESNFSFENLQASANRLKHWRKIADLRHQLYQAKDSEQMSFLATKRHLLELAQANLDTPQVLASIDQAFSKLAQLSLEQIDRSSLVELLNFIDQILGLDLITKSPDISDQYKQLIRQRDFARQAKDYKKADQLRQELLEAGIALDDRGERSIWYYL